MESDRAVIHELDALRLIAKFLAPGTAIMLVAPLNIGRRDRRSVMKFCASAQPACRALRVLGELEAFCERRMIVELFAGVLDEAVVQRHEEIVGSRCAIVMLRIEPAGCDIGVPSQHQLTLWRDARCSRRAAAWRRNLCQRYSATCQHVAPAQCNLPSSRAIDIA